jgi:hypothetical protein
VSALTGTTNLALVARLAQKPRKGVLDLLEIAENCNDCGLAVLVEVHAQKAIADHPRYPVATTVDIRGRRERVAKIMRLAEMINEDGLRALCQKATKTQDEHPRSPTTKADIVQLPKRPANKGRKARFADPDGAMRGAAMTAVGQEAAAVAAFRTD